MEKPSAVSFLGPRSGAEEGQNGSAEGKVWQIVSHLSLNWASCLHPPFLSLSLPLILQPACPPIVLPSFLPSCLFLPTFLYLFTKCTNYNPSPAIEPFCASVGSSVKWAYVQLSCRVAGINQDNESKCFMNYTMLFKCNKLLLIFYHRNINVTGVGNQDNFA